MNREERFLYAGWLSATVALMAGLIANAPEEDRPELQRAFGVVMRIMERQAVVLEAD